MFVTSDLRLGFGLPWMWSREALREWLWTWDWELSRIEETYGWSWAFSVVILGFSFRFSGRYRKNRAKRVLHVQP